MAYQVRCWDAFFQNWVMIPEEYSTREHAIFRAIELSEYYDCGENGCEEMQVYTDDLGYGNEHMVGYQMVGYVTLNEEGCFVFEEIF